MKRAGQLWPGIMERENWVRAYHQAARGKRWKVEVRRFGARLDERIDEIREAITARHFPVGKCHVFKVYDPKERTIHAASFEERVFHHALMNSCEAVLERHSVYHSYACRRGKGRLAGIEAAQKAARLAGGWYLKLDIRRYFESIPQGLLLERVGRLFKDREVLYWLERIIGSHRGAEGIGLPIGSLTSQHLANFYLADLDRFCQGLGGVRSYVRYMDDFVCWADSKADLLKAGRDIKAFVEHRLGLRLKHEPAPQPIARGMDFLGYRLFAGHRQLSRRSKVRYRRKLGLLADLHERGGISEGGLQQRLTSLTAFVLPTQSQGFRTRVLQKMGSAVIGHEPGEPGRQLEQQRQQLPGREPEQQQPGQPEQQSGLPRAPQLRPETPEGVALSSRELNRPPSRSQPRKGGDKRRNHPPGAGSAATAGTNVPGGMTFAEAPGQGPTEPAPRPSIQPKPNL